MNQSWELPGGRMAARHGETWVLYTKPGFVEYVGDAEGLQVYLTERGIA